MKPQIILLAGITGAGKSTILQYLKNQQYFNLFVGTKLTDRPKREGDTDWEFKFLKEIPKTESYIFESVGNKYAVNEKELNESISQGKNYVITLTDRKVIEKLRSNYKVLVLYVYRNMTLSELENLLQNRSGTKNELDSIRIKEFTEMSTSFVNDIDMYDHVILNIGTKESLYLQIEKILLLHGLLDI